MADTPELSENQKLALKRFGVLPEVKEEKKDDEVVVDKEAQATKAEEKSEVKEAQEGKKEKVIEVAQPAPAELTDEQLLEIASKRAGRKITSWDELRLIPTEEDKKKAEEARDGDRLSFGLKKGLFTKKQYEGFISDSKNPTELVYSRELADVKKEDGDWTEEKEKEFREEFETKFGLNLDDSSSKSKRGKKQLMMIADSILKNDYAPIYALDAAYSQHETAESTQKLNQQKIIQQAPVFKKDVEEIVSTLKTVEVDFAGEKFQVPLSQEALDALQETMLDNRYVSDQILKGYTKDDLKKGANQYMIVQHFNQLSFEAAKQYRQKHEKGVHGIPKGGELEKVVEDKNLTDQQKKALDFFRIPEKPVNAN